MPIQIFSSKMPIQRFLIKSFRLSSFLAQEAYAQHTHVCRHMSSSATLDNESTNEAEYPGILDLSPQEVYKRDRDSKLYKIKQLNTVEEKLIGINMPRFYGWTSTILREGNFPFNIMPFIQHITRTDYIDLELGKFPFSCSLDKREMENVINKIRPQLQDAILMEVCKKRPIYEVDGTKEAMGEGELSDELTKGVVEHINRILSANLALHASHLYEAEVDFEPRIEAFWRVGGFYPDNETYEKRISDKEEYEKELKNNRYAKRTNDEDPEDLVGHFFQYLGSPILQLRHAKPLKPLEPQVTTTAKSDSAKSEKPPVFRDPDLKQVPVLRYDPGFYGLERIRRHGTNIPGFWPGDPNEFGLLSFHSRGHLLGRPPSFGGEDITHTINSQAILAGYAWLLAQANYQGFSTFHDLTYPLTTTTIITDGRIFSFFASQLNTLLLHDEFIDVNPKVNVCYGLPSCELYQKIEGNEFVGWDDRALSLLVEAYLNTPHERKGVDLKPFLDKDIHFVKDIEHVERRDWLHSIFRHLFCNRPRGRLLPEIYDWEYIYKIKFQTRPMDARRRFFELEQDPWKRRLDDHAKVYIPRKFRDPNNYKKKFRDTFYPDC